MTANIADHLLESNPIFNGSGSPKPAEPCGLSREAIEQLAEAVAQSVSYEPAMALDEVVDAFGGDLQITDPVNLLQTGSIVVRNEGDFTITIPTFTSILRDRFTIGHEIGHYVLHYLLPKQTDADFPPMFASRYGSNRAEWEANWFASAFLMPSERVRSQWGGSQSVADLAETFNVSTAAARLRAARLELLS
ncbi:ImmA/IrrE family metallo-endopeptidase [Asticcacaulis solisilvae]|uniref:ImmA/IrrE family metallo-endopeptidase n=1 Tax=Asticcacaulis solisilvae TaxID=1217274 RepID=UPI003FD80E89